MNPAKSLSGLLFLVSVVEICIGALLDYGKNAGDTGIGAVDDGSFTVNMRSAIKFWNTYLTTLHINSNGVISSTSYSSTSSSWPQAPNNSLRVYHTDAIFNSQCGNCSIYIRTVLSTQDLKKINNLLRSKDQNFTADENKTLVTTWYNASQYGNQNKTNTFQSILTSNGEKTYAILSYDKLQYHKETSSRFATAGFKVSGNHYCTFVNKKRTSMKLQCRSNVFSPGLYVVGLTPTSEYQCDMGGNLTNFCSHCPGEEWFRVNCDNKGNVCGSNGMEYMNECELERERCRTNGHVEKSVCAGNFTFCDFEKDTCGLTGSNWIRRKGSTSKNNGPNVDASGNFTFCDFEKNSCGFTGSNWIRRGGQYPIKSTWPTVDASGNSSGFYFHFDARLSPLFSMHPISVVIPNPSKSSEGCLKFAYHMNGDDIGSLSVILSSSNVPPRTVWFTAADLESVWEETAVSLQQILKSSIPSYFNLTFVAIKGNGSRGEIAIDNVLVTYGSNCVVAAKSTPRTTAISEQNTDLKKVIAIATGGFVFVQIIFLLICVVIRRKAVKKADGTPTVQATVKMEDNEDYEIIQPNPSYYANVRALQLDKHSEHKTKNTNPMKFTEVEMQITTNNEYTSIDD
ncbi:uncharacterized protein LOC130622121 isoform X2 [Hydractinia symbiolongicarpus]|uniref:uncharacterized protein LOC130622121 isoform X2 n=1 Tax=Hydractinia symbiolongicarpus TaxID=13093 RepID=UPI002549EB23|nr:uncharacterized protein LOC130622121 isoform X2 [Hydractinia symbiolongicarpus]